MAARSTRGARARAFIQAGWGGKGANTKFVDDASVKTGSFDIDSVLKVDTTALDITRDLIPTGRPRAVDYAATAPAWPCTCRCLIID